MAREHARLLTRIWSDKDWCARTARAQRIYSLVISQRTINNAGVLPLQVSKWSRYAADTTVEDIEAGLAELIEHRYVFVDLDTEEVLVRTFVRNDGVVKQPNVFKSALRQAQQVESEALRKQLAAELRLINHAAAAQVAKVLDPNPSATLPQPFPNPYETLRDVFRSGESSTPERKTSGTLREPIAQGSGEGEGEGGKSSLVGGDLLGTRASESQTEEPPTPQDLDEERPTTGRPATRCPKHLDTTTDDVPCRACRACREAAEAWDADQARHAKARASSAARQHAEARALAISVCQLCDNDGYVGRVLCDHDPESAARAARGRQAVAPVLADKPAAQPKRRREPPADEPDLEIESARQRYLEQLAAVGAAEGDPPAGGEP